MRARICRSTFHLFVLLMPLLGYSQRAQSQICNIITYPYAGLPAGDNDPLIISLGKKIPADLEEAILVKRKERIRFLSRNLLTALAKSVDYENVAGVIDTILHIVSEEPNAFLFTTLETHPWNPGWIVLRAKIVDLRTAILAAGRVEISISHLSELNKKIKNLANDLAKQYTCINSIDTYNTPRFLNYPTLSSGVIAVGSVIWYFVEDDNVNDSYKDYRDATRIEDVTKFRIKTEKSLTRRKIAETSAIISGLAFGFFLLSDIFWYHEGQGGSSQGDDDRGKKPGEGIRIGINQSIRQESISIKMELSF